MVSKFELSIFNSLGCALISKSRHCLLHIELVTLNLIKVYLSLRFNLWKGLKRFTSM